MPNERRRAGPPLGVTWSTGLAPSYFVIDQRVAEELERIGAAEMVTGSGQASMLAEYAALGRVASHQVAEIIGLARRNGAADDRSAGPGNSWAWIAAQLGVTKQAAHERYGKIPPAPSDSEMQHADEDCRLELSRDLTHWGCRCGAAGPL